MQTIMLVYDLITARATVWTERLYPLSLLIADCLSKRLPRSNGIALPIWGSLWI